ncbi:MAG: hypothetical protein KC502_05425 [Myxococcales bacterium]|nr:hypothetical protein [Myxococcales bacterium]
MTQPLFMTATLLSVVLSGCTPVTERPAPSLDSVVGSSHVHPARVERRLARGGPTQPKVNLPRLVSAQRVDVGRVVTVMVVVPGGHKLNADGPSWLALFEQPKDGPARRIFAADRDAILSGALVLPTLVPGQRYRLQGSLFFCSDGACLLQSHDQILQATPADASSLDVVLVGGA